MREALVFAAMLRLPPAMTADAKRARAMAVAGLLNLSKSLDSVVGSSLLKGISGEERRSEGDAGVMRDMRAKRGQRKYARQAQSAQW